MKKSWMQVATLSAFAGALFVSIAGAVAYPLLFFQTTVILVRHAEKAAGPPDNPPLNQDGFERAQTLAHVAGQAGVNFVLVTEYLRSKQTAEPLKSQLGIEPIEIPKQDTDALCSRIRSLPGYTILVVGHSDTVPAIIQKLTGAQVGPIADNEFDNLFVVTIPRWGNAKVVRLKYGKPT